MPGTYAPRGITLDVLKRLDEVNTPEEKIDILRSALEAMASHQKSEGKAVAFAIKSAAGEKANVRIVDADTVVTSSDRTIFFDSSGGNVDAALPGAAEYPGLTLCFKEKTGGGTSTVTPRGTDTINGSAGSITVTTPVWLQAHAATNNWETL